jgi:large subunit ribosomal protein L25
LPLDIPEYFNVDVGALDIGDAVHVEDVAMPEGVKAIYESNFALVTVVTPTVEEAPTPAAAAEAPTAEAAAPEAAKEGEA